MRVYNSEFCPRTSRSHVVHVAVLKMRSKKQAKNVNILPANEITSGKQLSAPDCSNSSSKQTEAVNRQKRWRI